MNKIKWWMRVVGAVYVLQFVMMVVVRAPIRTVGPEGVLAQAAAGDPVARFLVDTWVTLGLVVGAVGVGLLVTSRTAQQARFLVWTVIGIEVASIVNDVYMITRGYILSVFVVWIFIHSIFIVTGVILLRSPREGTA